jgi:hypothetical protein
MDMLTVKEALQNAPEPPLDLAQTLGTQRGLVARPNWLMVCHNSPLMRRHQTVIRRWPGQY